MKTALFVQSARSPGGRRTGLTLMEILIAVGVMMIGMVGILALFPVAIRSIQEAVHLTLGAPAAKNLIASLTHYCVDLSADGGVNPFATLDLNGDGVYDASEDAILNRRSTNYPYHVNDTDCYAWYGQVAPALGDPPPSTLGGWVSGELSAAEKDTVRTDDASAVSDAGPGCWGHRFDFKVIQKIEKIAQIVLVAKGWGSAVTPPPPPPASFGANLYVWNNSLGEWELLDFHAQGASQTLTGIISSGFSDYVTSGYVYGLITGPGGEDLGSIQTYYAELVVTTSDLEWNISEALAAYHAAEVAAGRRGIGHGYPAPSFRIPDDLLNRNQVGVDFGGDGMADTIPLLWYEDYGRQKALGLTAVFVPIPIDELADGDELGDEDPLDGIDNDGDGSIDEDPVDGIDNDGDGLTDEDPLDGIDIDNDEDGLTNEDPPVITDTSIYSVQVAVWHNYRLIADIDDGAPGGVKGLFRLGFPDEVLISDENGEFWRKVRPGDYIRHRAHGIWYRIEELDKPTVRLVQEFKHPMLVQSGDFLNPRDFLNPGGRPARVDLASRFRLVTLHEGVVGHD